MKNIPSLRELVDSVSTLETFKWGKSASLNQFLEQFSEKVQRVQSSCGGILSDQHIVLCLLRSSNLDKLEHCLGNLNINELSFSAVKDLVRKVYRDTSNDNVDTSKDQDKNNPPSPVKLRGWSDSEKGSQRKNRIMGQDPTATKHLPLLDYSRQIRHAGSNHAHNVRSITNAGTLKYCLNDYTVQQFYR